MTDNELREMPEEAKFEHLARQLTIALADELLNHGLSSPLAIGTLKGAIKLIDFDDNILIEMATVKLNTI